MYKEGRGMDVAEKVDRNTESDTELFSWGANFCYFRG